MITIDELNALDSGTIQAKLAGPPSRAADFVRSAAEAGIAEAQLVLGQILLDGYGVKPAPIEAVRWFARAAKQGHAMAMNMVGRCYENGSGIAADYARAAEWYRAAADHGLDWGMYNLATLLALGEGVPLDRPAALALFPKAAALGHVKSINMIGSFYEDGWAVEPDLRIAADHYRHSAELGDFRGIFNHARMLLEVGCLDEAVDWLGRLPTSAPPRFLINVCQWLEARPEPQLRRIAAEFGSATIDPTGRFSP